MLRELYEGDECLFDRACCEVKRLTHASKLTG